MTSTFGKKLRRLLKIFKRFGKHCSCHLQGECLWECKGAVIVEWEVSDVIGRAEVLDDFQRGESTCFKKGGDEMKLGIRVERR
jgi:hypothetical protein